MDRTQGHTASGTGASDDVIIIKKYANRRLYNTAQSRYVTLEDLAEMVRDGLEFRVEDAKTGEDLTRGVLTQIIFEQEAKTGQNLLSTEVLRQLIQFYGHQMQIMVPDYLQAALTNFTQNQEAWAQQWQKAAQSHTPMKMFEQQVEANMALFNQAMTAFNPFAPSAKPQTQTTEASSQTSSSQAPSPEASAGSDLQTLQAQLSDLQAEVTRMKNSQQGQKP